MSFDWDYLDQLDDEELTEEIVRLARTRGALVAFRSAVELCQDAKAPAQARASAQRVILQFAGLLDRRNNGADTKKELHEMDGMELQAEYDRLSRAGAGLRERLAAAQKQGDVFG